MIENRWLEYFLAVAREGNITRAAESLHIAQPSLTRQIQVLEEQLGKKLFVRGRREMTLTEAGVYLRGRAQEILGLVEKTEGAFSSDPDRLTGDITIGCGETPAMDFITEIWEEIHGEHPDIRFHIFSGNAESVYEKLEQGLIDVGLLLGATPLDKFDYMSLGRADRFGILLPDNHPLADRQSICFEDLRGESLIISAQASHGIEQNEQLSRHLAEMKVLATYNLIYNAVFMVRRGMGLALCLENLVDTSPGSGLAFVPLTPEISVPIYLATKKYHTPSSAVRYFLEKMERSVRRVP